MDNLPDKIENVVIFVGDAVKYDDSHEKLATLGQTYKTVAGSLHTPASFATLYTGRFVPHHGVTNFAGRLGKNVFSLFNLNNNGVNVKQAPYFGKNQNIIDIFPNAESGELENLSPPFVYLERDGGGHAPYGEHDRENEGWKKGRNASEYMKDHSGEQEKMEEDYQRGIAESISAFNEYRDQLRERDLLDSTLCIFTSDHGEAIGEYGYLGHNHIACPDIVYVPTTICHPDIDSGHSSRLAHNADIVPTILDVLQMDVANEAFDGSSLFDKDSTTIGYNHYESTFYSTKLSRFRRNVLSLWESDGGHVFIDSPKLHALAVFTGFLLKSPKRDHIIKNKDTIEVGKQFISGRIYGDPRIPRKEAKNMINSISENQINKNEVKLSEDKINHLEDMGYI